MAYCELCDIDLEFCGHGLVERHTNAAATTRQLLISPNGTANRWRLPAESAPESPAGCPQRPPSSLSGWNVDRGPGKVAVVPWCQGMRFSPCYPLIDLLQSQNSGVHVFIAESRQTVPGTTSQAIRPPSCRWLSGPVNSGMWPLSRIEFHDVSAQRQGRGGNAPRGIVPPRVW